MTSGDTGPPSPPDPATETRAAFQGTGALAEFTLDFAKAMLRTGYYAPDHPQSQQSRIGLYEEFIRVLVDRSGLTYLVGHEGERRLVMIEGYGTGHLALENIMIHGMAEMFTPKLLEFFDRRHLLSFSLRAGIAAEEFDAFVVLMSEPPTTGRANDERDRVTQAFLDQNIVHVSTLFEADVIGRERRLPWRVERALSRLGRDLSLLPLYKDASEEQIQQTKIQIIDEVIRPLRTPELLVDLLLNCDVLARDIVVLEQVQIEHEIIAQIPIDLLISTTSQMLDGLQKLATEENESSEVAPRYRLIIRGIVDRLGQAQVEVDGELLEAVVRQEVFTREELPESLQEMLERQLVFQDFLTDRDDYLTGFGQFPAGGFEMRLAGVARVAFPALLRRGDYREAAAMLDALASGRHESGAADTVHELVESFRQLVAAEENVRRLLEALSDEKLEKPVRDSVVMLLSLGGAAAVARLQEVYAATASLPVRASAFDTMRLIGPAALKPFLAGLSAAEPEWSEIHHVLVGLEDQTDPALADSVKPFLQHENAHVRQAALTRVFELLGSASEDSLIVALGDPDPAMRRAAVTYLGSIHSRDPKVLAFYAGALQIEGLADGEREDEDVLVEICRSLAGVGDATFQDDSNVEQILLNALPRKPKKKRISGMFQRRPAHHSERAQIAICEALGIVGTTDTADALRELASGETENVAEAARLAAEQIGSRSPS